MKAMVYTQYGTPDVLHLQEVAQPTPKDDEVLIRVHAASLNSWDLDRLRGDWVNRLIYGGLQRPKLPILGCDVAGVVETIGRTVTRWRPGDVVFGDISACGWGALAEYVCAHESALTLKPVGLTFAQAAALPQAGVLAIQSLCDMNPVQPGQTVLINGAGGGVGTFAIQLAKAFGAEVTGVDSTSKLDRMRSLGADHVLDYTQSDFTRTGQHYDRIVDVMARRGLADYQRALQPGGLFVMIGGAMALVLQIMLVGSWLAKREQKQLAVLVHQPNKELPTLLELFAAGKVVPVIDHCYPLAETPVAFRRLCAGEVFGKVVITVAV